MRSVALRTRINQITIMMGVSFLFYQLTNWEQGVWVLFSTIVVAGPISTVLGFEKSKDRVLGTLAGVLVAFCLEYYIYYMPSQLPIVGVCVAMFVGFMVTRPYKYFVIMITTCTCLGYTYMNMPFTSFEPASYVVYRMAGVFVGVSVFLVLQKFVFGNGNAKLELIETSHNTLLKLQASLRQYQANQTLLTAYQCATDIFSNSTSIKSYVNTSHYVLGSGGQAELRYANKVVMLSNRALKLLVDTPNVSPEKIAKLLHIIDLELERG
jgi:hypothetical protein